MKLVHIESCKLWFTRCRQFSRKYSNTHIPYTSLVKLCWLNHRLHAKQTNKQKMTMDKDHTIP